MTVKQLEKLLVKAGRKRGITEAAEKLAEIFALPQMRRLPAVERALGETLHGLLRALDGEMQALDALEASLVAAIAAHPIHELVDSIPGLGYVTAGRILRDPSALKAYAGTAPVTVSSGKSETVRFRNVRNTRLHSAAWTWSFTSLANSRGARAHYDRRKEFGDKHAAAVRNLANRLLGCLHHCLRTGQLWDEKTAFGVAGHPRRKEDAIEPDKPLLTAA